MDANPVLKPKLATPALILSSVTIAACIVYLVGAAAAERRFTSFLILAAVATLPLAAVIGTIWLSRRRKHHVWTAVANEKWKRFNDAKQTLRTTTEVTVMSVDGLEPTGSWITIRWNRFDHVQRAWIEALNEPIWPGSVLLIEPDSAQVRPGAPWPPTYFIRASNYLAWAPARRFVEGGVSPLSANDGA